MKRQIQSFNIGNGKRLVLETDPDNEHDQEFVKECQEVVETKPATLQDFFVTLANVQKKKQKQFIAQNDQEEIKGLRKR